jgi:uncharacterized protein
MGTVGWLLLIAVGIALGFGTARLWPGGAARVKTLEQERDAAREELSSYRQEVNAHFAHTAELFDKVTADYRSLYEHLALSARQLGAIRGESVRRPLAEPEQRRLGPVAPLTADAPPAEAMEERPDTEASADEPRAPRDYAEPPEEQPGEETLEITPRPAEPGAEAAQAAQLPAAPEAEREQSDAHAERPRDDRVVEMRPKQAQTAEPQPESDAATGSR